MLFGRTRENVEINIFQSIFSNNLNENETK